jgi:hypothetical protein
MVYGKSTHGEVIVEWRSVLGVRHTAAAVIVAVAKEVATLISQKIHRIAFGACPSTLGAV